MLVGHMKVIIFADLSFDWSRTRWRSATALADIVTPLFGVIFRAGNVSDGLTVADAFLEQLLQEGAAPATTGPSTKALTQLPRTLGFLDANEVRDFAPRDVEAEADFAIEIHDMCCL